MAISFFRAQTPDCSRCRVLTDSVRGHLLHILGRFYVMTVYEVDVVQLQSFQAFVHTFCDSVCTEVLILARYVFANFCGHENFLSRQVLDASAQELHRDEDTGVLKRNNTLLLHRGGIV